MNSTATALSQDARLLKRGDTHDFECWRTSHRLSIARAALKSAQIDPTIAPHDETCLCHPDNRVKKLMQFGAEPAPCRCELAVTWPDKATDDIFNAAIAFAFAVQNGRRDARNASQ